MLSSVDGSPTQGAPDRRVLLGGYPSGRARVQPFDYLLFQLGKTRGRLGRLLLGTAKIPPHRQLLTTAVAELLRLFEDPVCLETGCVRYRDEGTRSTLAIASTLAGRGRFYTFELDPGHIEVCREVCSRFEGAIEYVQGDAAVELRRLREGGVLERVHLAFLDSADDRDQIWNEFRAIEDLFVPSSLLIVDDAIRGVKGRRIKPYLRRHPSWETYSIYEGNGLLVAIRRAGASGQ